MPEDSRKAHKLRVLAGELSVCRLPPGSPAPAPGGAGFHSVTRTANELSVVCHSGAEPPGATVEPGWRAVEVAGPLEFSEIGVLASLAVPLGRAGVSIFVISTYDTDYLLVRRGDLAAARAVLEAAGHTVVDD